MVPGGPTPQLPPEVLLARMVLTTITVTGSCNPRELSLQMAPPPGALLPEKVQLVTVSLLPLKMAPPSKALLPKKVLLVTLSVPARVFMMAPPLKPALLPEKVLLVTLSVPPLKMAPPSPKPGAVLLPEKVLLVTVAMPPSLAI